MSTKSVVGRDSAAATSSASCVRAGRRLTRSSSSAPRLGGTGTSCPWDPTRCISATISMACSGLPPAAPVTRTAAGRAREVPVSRLMISCSAATVSGPSDTRRRRAGSARSKVSTGAPSSRTVTRKPTGSCSSRRSAKASARADAMSSHCASSTATSIGPAALMARTTPRTDANSARSSTPLGVAARSRAPAKASAWGRGNPVSTSSPTSPKRSASPRSARPASASVARVVSTVNPELRARSTPARQMVVFPIPGAPSTARISVRVRASSSNVSRAANSCSRPTTPCSGAYLTAMGHMVTRSPYARIRRDFMGLPPLSPPW